MSRWEDFGEGGVNKLMDSCSMIFLELCSAPLQALNLEVVPVIGRNQEVNLTAIILPKNPNLTVFYWWIGNNLQVHKWFWLRLFQSFSDKGCPFLSISKLFSLWGETTIYSTSLPVKKLQLVEGDGFGIITGEWWNLNLCTSKLIMRVM